MSYRIKPRSLAARFSCAHCMVDDQECLTKNVSIPDQEKLYNTYFIDAYKVCFPAILVIELRMQGLQWMLIFLRTNRAAYIPVAA